MIKKQFNLQLFSQFRTELMGLATIGILCCHTKANGVVMPGWLWGILSLGSVGTAMFFFLSGIGIWYSLRKIKYERHEILSWYKRRYIKLFVPFLILAVPYFAYTTLSGGHNLWYFISRVTTIEYWISGGGAWFVSIIVVLYLFSPWWEFLIRKTKLNLLLSVFAFLFILFSGSWISHSSRICFYFLGFGIAPLIEKGLTIRWLPLIAGSILLYVICSIVPIVSFFPRYIFLVPIFIIIPCILFDTKWFERMNGIFRFMGKISLESYLTNVFLPTFFIKAAWIHNYPVLCNGNRICYLLVIVVGIGLAYAAHLLSEIILSKISLK